MGEPALVIGSVLKTRKKGKFAMIICHLKITATLVPLEPGLRAAVPFEPDRVNSLSCADRQLAVLVPRARVGGSFVHGVATSVQTQGPREFTAA